MNTSFLSQRLLTTARYQHKFIPFKKDRLYYYKYMKMLGYNLAYLGAKDVDQAIQFVKSFETEQTNRIKNGFFTKPKKMVELVCRDAVDVLEGMQRWDGVGVEKWDFWGEKPEVKFGRVR
jgi:hypothetical protein